MSRGFLGLLAVSLFLALAIWGALIVTATLQVL